MFAQILSSLAVAALAALPFSFKAANAEGLTPCGIETSCQVNDRSYRVATPNDWDGIKKLPVLIHFHGWGRTGTNVIRNQKIAGATKETGVLLLAPDGIGRSWSFWSSPSRDVPFVKAMLEDAAKRWPIDRNRIYVSGFSYGGAMAWRLACEEGQDFAAFLSIAGTLWNTEEVSDCPSPIRLRHVHGLRDTVMDLPRGEGGDPRYSVSPWVSVNGCSSKSNGKEAFDIYERHIWKNCNSRNTVELDLHDGGHIIPKGWLKRELERLNVEDAS